MVITKLLPGYMLNVLYHIEFNQDNKQDVDCRDNTTAIHLFDKIIISKYFLSIFSGMSLGAACSHLGVFFSLYLVDKDKH